MDDEMDITVDIDSGGGPLAHSLRPESNVGSLLHGFALEGF